jgi:hypothetical protein
VRRGNEPYQPWFATWIQKLQEELQTNSRGFLSQRAFAVARRLPAEFPPLETIKMHVTPIVNDRHLASAIQVPRCVPDLSLLVAMCQKLFTFGECCAPLQRKFRTMIWAGLVTQVVVTEAVLRDGDQSSRQNEGRSWQLSSLTTTNVEHQIVMPHLDSRGSAQNICLFASPGRNILGWTMRTAWSRYQVRTSTTSSRPLWTTSLHSMQHQSSCRAYMPGLPNRQIDHYHSSASTFPPT